MVTHPHLSTIDATSWPGVARVPSGRLVELRARIAEAAFARACNNAGLDVDPAGSPDLVVEHEELFARLAVSGWLGLAEGYMAGEWRSERLTEVLTALLSVGYQPRVGFPKLCSSFGDYDGGELPSEIIRLSSGDGMSAFGGVFATGVPTTVRTAVPSQVQGEKKSSNYFIDLTTYSEPIGAERNDLGDAQSRSVDMLLDATRVAAGTHLLEFPSTGGAVAIGASARRATVDSLTADPDQAEAVSERLMLAGVHDSVRTEIIQHPVPRSQDWRGRYDAIISVEKLETLSEKDREIFMRSLDRMLTVGGYIGMQSTIATEAMTPAGTAALSVLRAYIWPDLNYPSTEAVHRLVDRGSGLRIVGRTHVGSHTELSMAMRRSLLEGHAREAAAAGFDIVFRRLSSYQFALREAMFNLGMLDAVQFTLTHRNRSGRR